MLDSIYDLPMIEDHVTLNLCYDHEFAECAELSTVPAESISDFLKPPILSPKPEFQKKSAQVENCGHKAVHSEHPVHNPCHVCPLNFWRNMTKPYVLTMKHRNSNIHRLSIQRRKMGLPLIPVRTGKYSTDRRCQHSNRKRACSKCNPCLICFNGEYGPANTILHRQSRGHIMNVIQRSCANVSQLH